MCCTDSVLFARIPCFFWCVHCPQAEADFAQARVASSPESAQSNIYRIRCTHLARSAGSRGAAAKLESSTDTSFANHYLCLERLAKRRLRTSHPTRSAGLERVYDRNTLTSGYRPPLWKSAGAKRSWQPQMQVWNVLITEGPPVG